MAKKYWQGKNPVGQRILIGQGVGPNFADVPREIVGIAADTRDEGLDEEPQATMIIPEAQEPDGITAMWSQFGPMYWLVRTRTATQSVMTLVAEQLRLASAGLPVGRTRTMQEAIAQSITRQDFNMLLLTVFAASALLLSGVGIYGVMAYSVAQRTREIGIRMALGAERSTIRTLVLREGMRTALAGVAIGLGAAFMLVRLMASFIFGVQAHDALTFIVVPVVLASVALIAVWLPARRAAQLEPIEAMRAE
jgi:ABC-type antimicrobial peptide transport system permease subunit